MTEEQLQRLIKANEVSTGAAIQKYVNGGISRLDTKLDLHIEDNKHHNELDKEWKDKAQPLIDTFTNLSGAGKIVVMVAGGIATIIGAVYAVKTLIIK